MKVYLLIAFILIGLSSTEVDNSAQKISSKRILRKADLKTILKIQFCQSWSSAGYFRHVKEQLESLFSDISVVAEQYPLKNPRKTIKKCPFKDTHKNDREKALKTREKTG